MMAIAVIIETFMLAIFNYCQIVSFKYPSTLKLFLQIPQPRKLLAGILLLLLLLFLLLLFYLEQERKQISYHETLQDFNTRCTNVTFINLSSGTNR